MHMYWQSPLVSWSRVQVEEILYSSDVENLKEKKFPGLSIFCLNMTRQKYSSSPTFHLYFHHASGFTFSLDVTDFHQKRSGIKNGITRKMVEYKHDPSGQRYFLFFSSAQRKQTKLQAVCAVLLLLFYLEKVNCKTHSIKYSYKNSCRLFINIKIVIFEKLTLL